MNHSAHFRRVFDGSLEQLGPIRAFVSQVIAACGGSQEDEFAFELACDEAATNVFSHAFAGEPGRLEIEMWRQERTVLVRLNYRGASFDPTRVAAPNLDVPLEERPTGGLGLYFMRQLMSEVAFEFDSDKGNVLTMRRALAD